jgi:hypothetical protein
MALPALAYPLIAAGIGGVASFFGGRAQASAQQRIAEAQLQAAREAIAQQRREREQALGFAGPSSVELDMQSQMLDLSNQVLGRANRELQFLSQGLDITSPGAAQAGRGLFSELIARTRANQRSSLQMQLQERLGAGYATSSAGQSALQQFDQGTADIGVQAIPQFLQTAYGAMQAPLTLQDAISRRQIGAATGTPVAPMMFQTSQMAGAENVGSALRGQALGQFGSTISNLGGMALGGYMQGFGGRAPASAPSPVPSIGSTQGVPVTLGSYFSQPTWQSQVGGRFSL